MDEVGTGVRLGQIFGVRVGLREGVIDEGDGETTIGGVGVEVGTGVQVGQQGEEEGQAEQEQEVSWQGEQVEGRSAAATGQVSGVQISPILKTGEMVF